MSGNKSIIRLLTVSDESRAVGVKQLKRQHVHRVGETKQSFECLKLHKWYQPERTRIHRHQCGITQTSHVSYHSRPMVTAVPEIPRSNPVIDTFDRDYVRIGTS